MTRARPRAAAPVAAGLLALGALALSSLALGLLGPATPTQADEPGAFDYYVLSLSWSPNWCALDGEGSPQCEGDANGGRGFGWVLHGLWPQDEVGWPSDCPSAFSPPSRQEAGSMADVMGTPGLARHAWERHGTCSGLSPGDYFRLSRRAFEAVKVPDAFARLARAVELPAQVVEEAFLRAAPRLVADGVTVTCRDGLIQEVRLCLTRDLLPRPCAPDARRDCRLVDALMESVP